MFILDSLNYHSNWVSSKGDMSRVGKTFLNEGLYHKTDFRFNEFAKQTSGEASKGAQTRALLFDISFLMLCHIMQLYGTEVSHLVCLMTRRSCDQHPKPAVKSSPKTQRFELKVLKSLNRKYRLHTDRSLMLLMRINGHKLILRCFGHIMFEKHISRQHFLHFLHACPC